MDYISLVDIENKKMYDLGKITEAKYYLPYFADKFNGKPIILFGDETHPQLDDEYVLKEYGGEYEECFVGNENCNDDILCDINITIIKKKQKLTASFFVTKNEVILW